MDRRLSNVSSPTSVASYCHMTSETNEGSSQPVELNTLGDVYVNENDLVHPYHISLEEEETPLSAQFEEVHLRIQSFAPKQATLNGLIENVLQENLHNDTNIIHWKSVFDRSDERVTKDLKINSEQLVQFCATSCSISPSSAQMFGLWNSRTNSWIKLWEPIVLSRRANQTNPNVVNLLDNVHLEFKIRFFLKASRNTDTNNNNRIPQEPNVFNYLFHQTRHDFIQHGTWKQHEINEKTFETSALTLAVIDLLHVSFLLQKIPKEVLKAIDVSNLLPKSLQYNLDKQWFIENYKWKFMAKKRLAHLLKETVPKNSNMQTDEEQNENMMRFLQLSYLQCMEREFPSPGNVFQLFQPGELVVVSGDEGIEIKRTYDVEGSENVPCLIPLTELANVTISKTSPTVYLSNLQGKHEELHFISMTEALSFTSCVDGYYQVLVDPTHYLCRDVASNTRLMYARLHCFTNMSRVACETRLKDYVSSQPTALHQCCLLRRCNTEFESFYLSLWQTDKTFHFKIHRGENKLFGIFGLDASYKFQNAEELLVALERNEVCEDIKTDVFMQHRIYPSTQDRQPILFTKKVEVGSVLPRCVSPEDIQEIKTMLYPTKHTHSYIHIYKPTNKLVMVRTLNEMDLYSNQRKDLLNESYQESLKILSKVGNHIHVITWLGNSSANKEVLEYSNFGSVTEYMFKRAKEKITQPDFRVATSATWLMQVIYQLTHIMNYLEERNLPHGRICGERLHLFREDPWIKLADPEVQVDLDETVQNNPKIVPNLLPPWLPCEFSEMCSTATQWKPTLAGDKWSFAVTVCEIMMAAADFKIDYSLPQISNAQKNCYMQSNPVPIHGWLNIIGKTSLATLLRRCWDKFPPKRPSFRIILQTVSRILRSEEYETVVLNTGQESHIVHKRCIAQITEFPQEFIFRDKDLTFRQLVGEGQFGTVSLHQYCPNETASSSNHNTFAVKRFKPGENKFQSHVEIIRELQTMISLKHEYVVELKGIALPSNGIVMEYLPIGSLYNYMLNRKNRKSPFKSIIGDLYRYLYQIAQGMVALQELRIIHRDLAARNILLAADSNSNKMKAKIADFGLSRSLPHHQEEYFDAQIPLLPLKWLAPECYRNENPQFNLQSDVWGYGVTAYEILDNISETLHMMQCKELVQRINMGWKWPKPKACQNDHAWMYEMMLKCWHMKPDQRITFPEIVRCFQEQCFVE
ncbi:tyrosine-protein kinase JAK2-like [Ciona intestinalis]